MTTRKRSARASVCAALSGPGTSSIEPLVIDIRWLRPKVIPSSASFMRDLVTCITSASKVLDTEGTMAAMAALSGGHGNCGFFTFDVEDWKYLMHLYSVWAAGETLAFFPTTWTEMPPSCLVVGSSSVSSIDDYAVVVVAGCWVSEVRPWPN